MKNILAIFFFSLLFCSEISADITSQLLKLNEMYRSETITEEEFKKAKSILLKMDETKTEEAETKISKDVILTLNINLVVVLFIFITIKTINQN